MKKQILILLILNSTLVIKPFDQDTLEKERKIREIVARKEVIALQKHALALAKNQNKRHTEKIVRKFCRNLPR